MQSREIYTGSSSPGITKIHNRWIETDSMAGVGIDPDVSKIPDEIWDEVGGKDAIDDGIFLFNKRIIDATAEHVVDFKVNSNFFQGELGRKALQSTFDYLKDSYPSVLRVCDGTFADVGHTAEKIADEIFGTLDADAVLLNPYMGRDAIEPFTKWNDKLVIMCVNTSNQSAAEIQNLTVQGRPLWRKVLDLSLNEWNGNGNVIPVLSATHVDNLVNIRDTIQQTPVLLAGVGQQGGDIADALPHTLDNNGYGVMISASRSILYAERQTGESFERASARAALSLKKKIREIRDSL